MRVLAGLMVLLGVACAGLPATAHPARIIILRHAEKQNHLALCRIGVTRANALAASFLGRHAADQVLLRGVTPAAFYSVTLHTLETIAPAAASWDMPQRTYALPPAHDLSRDAEDVQLNRATQDAARSIMSDRSLDGGTIVIAWEHRHIADPRIEARYPGQAVTLRQLLHLDALANVPSEWQKANYNYFWIIDYADTRSDLPTGFRMMLQRFNTDIGWLPLNVWGQRDGLSPGRCPADRNDMP